MTATTVATPAAENGSGKPSANEHLENEVSVLSRRAAASRLAQARVADSPKLAFYASYHSNPINVGIHFVFIPQIWW